MGMVDVALPLTHTYYVYTEAHMKNITLSIDESVLEAGREYARRHNTSFNALVRELVERTVMQDHTRWLDDCFKLMDKAGVSSDGQKWDRESLHRV